MDGRQTRPDQGVVINLDAGRLRISVLALILSGLGVGLTSSSLAQAPEPSRWWSPSQPTRPEVLVPDFAGPLRMEQVFPDVVPPAATATNRICLVVQDAVYPAIAARVTRFATDLQAAGYSVLTYRFASGSAPDLRSYLAACYNQSGSLKGAILIGNLPYIVYELLQNWGGGNEYEDFACDVFYMDLNGTWRDTNAVAPFSSGKYDTWTGDTALEIWVSRMKVDNLPYLGQATNLVNAYFDKNHAYRTHAWHGSVKALVYADDDWEGLGASDQEDIEPVYGSAITLVNAPNTTTAADYRDNRLPLGFELITTRSHGSPGGHGYYQNDRAQFIYFDATNYVGRRPNSLFYGFFVCSGSDYSSANYLAGISVFNTNRSGLLAWGSTKTGGMWNDWAYYNALANRACFGEAFKTWFNANRAYSGAPQWWYGMVLIGDASLKPSVFMEPLSAFTFRAFALTNQVALRWTSPVACGLATNLVMVRHSTATYPASITNGALIYQGADTHCEHEGVASGSTNYYTIWVSHDGSAFFPPP